MKCPHCGAPPPPEFTIPVGQFGYACVYCRQTSVLGTPVAAPPPQATGPTFIVLGRHGDDDDDDDARHQHHHHHASAVVHASGISWIVWLIVVLAVSLGGSGAAFMRCSKHSKLISSFVWDGSEPLQCGGVEEISVTGVTATFTGGAAIQAAGNCHVRCTDCTITAPTAIEASGNAEVTIMNGTIRGTTMLADASGNAHVTISGNVTASGRIHEGGNGKVSAPPSVSASAAAPPPPAAATKPPPAATPAKTSKGAPPAVKPKASGVR